MARFWRGVSLPLALLLLGPAPLLRPQPAAAQANRQETAREPQLRVLLVEGPSATVAAPTAAGLRLRDRQGRPLLELAGTQPLQLRLRAGWLELRPVPVQADVSAMGASAAGAAAAGAVAARALAAGPVPAGAGSAEAQPLLAATELWLEPIAASTSADGVLVLQQRRYRGRLQVIPAGSGLQVINHVPLETYLPSVVGSEMPASWPQQALRAQAVAARTYALKGRRPEAGFDLKATVASQVYRGVEAETPSTREAVAATRGLVLTYGQGLINAVFHSSSGGSTESSGELWPQQLPYLVSVPDFDQDSPVRQWRQPLAPDLLAKAFAEIGGVRSIEVVATTSTGRVRQARVVGPAGQLLLSGAALRNRLGLRSTWVRFELEVPEAAAGINSGALPPAPPPPLPAFSLPAAAFSADPGAAPVPLLLPQWVAVGRGFGHGIGMSQWGALAMARRGDSFDAILSHYYRGAQLRPYRELASATAAGPGSWRAQISDGDAKVVAVGPRSRP
jgi:stage II sporulation protein D